MSSLMERMLKNSTIKGTAILDNSDFFNNRKDTALPIYALNIIMSGSLKSGYLSGLHQWAGPSKHGKSVLSLLCVAAYLEQYPDAIMIFFDSEFGAPKSYFDAFGIDSKRILHVPLLNMEEFKFDIMKKLNDITKDDKVVILIDSFGNLASLKEVEDAANEKTTADMSRAKQGKSIWRMVTPHLTIKDIPMFVVNHTYQTMEMFSKTVTSGGTGLYYSCNSIYIMGRSQEKDGDALAGWNLNITVEKSRGVVEKSKIPIQLLHGKGINRWSGLLDVALESGHVVKPSNGWFCRVVGGPGSEVETRKWRRKETDCAEFWLPLINDDPTFETWINNKYKLSNGKIIQDGLDIPEADLED